MRKFARPGVLLGIIAVVLAMSTGAFAAAKITGAQIKDSTITGKDVKNRSLGTADFSRATIASLRGEQGPAGPAGPQGAPGAPGAPGPAGPSAVAKISPVVGTASLPAGELDIFTMDCPAGQSVVNGGFTIFLGDVWLSKTYDGRSWSIGISNWDNGIPSEENEIWAYCAPSGSAVAGIASKAKPKKMTRSQRAAAIEEDVAAYRAAQQRAR